MYRDALDPDLFPRAILLVYGHILDASQRLPALKQPPKDCILAIQVRRLVKRDEELAAVGFGALVRHAQHSPSIVPQRRLNLVFERFDPN